VAAPGAGGSGPRAALTRAGGRGQAVQRAVASSTSRRPARLKDTPARELVAALPADLTERERETLELLAQGLSDREIAAAMYIGEATAETHVSRLLTKLGVRDRVQTVVLAYERGLVRPGAARRPDGPAAT